MPELSRYIDSVTDEEVEELRVIRRDMRQSDLIYIIFTSGNHGKTKGCDGPAQQCCPPRAAKLPGGYERKPG